MVKFFIWVLRNLKLLQSISLHKYFGIHENAFRLMDEQIETSSLIWLRINNNLNHSNVFCVHFFVSSFLAVMRYLIKQWSLISIIFLFQLYEVNWNVIWKSVTSSLVDFYYWLRRTTEKVNFQWIGNLVFFDVYDFFLHSYLSLWLEWFLFHCAYWFLTICVALKRMNRIAIVVMLYKNFYTLDWIPRV